MSLIKRRSIELIVIRDVFNPSNNIEQYQGRDVEQLLKQAFGDSGLSQNVRLYHNELTNDVTPKTPDDVDKIMKLNGRIYAVVRPMGLDPFSWVIIGISILVSVAAAFMMPKMPELGSSNQAPSPNNALAARTNRERLGGRVPDIYGTVWSVPDLIAPNYSVYVNNREVEFSYMCVGRGRFNVTEALDDTTPINQVFGSSVLVFDPDSDLSDIPSFTFGSTLTPEETELARLSVKRYTSVNGQILPPPNGYSILNNAEFISPNIIDVKSTSVANSLSIGGTINVEQAANLASSTGAVDEQARPITYTLSGIYTVQSKSGTRITLSNPSSINSDWQKLTNNSDRTSPASVTVSSQQDNLWQGWFYTSGKDHEYALLNLVAPNGLYNVTEGLYESLAILFDIETELVDPANNPIPNTKDINRHRIKGNKFDVYAVPGAVGVSGNATRNKDDERAATAATTVKIINPNFSVGDRMRVRIRRITPRVDFGENQQAVQEVRIADFYGARLMSAVDTPKGVTTVYTKTLATEGALSLKERKLRLLVQRYVTDATSGLPKLSNRADDIIRHIATDSKIGNLDISQVDIAQIKTEIDTLIAYFGTDKCAEFCSTFDDNNLSSEETLQIVAKAVFSQAKRQGNKIMLDFERLVPASVAVFNSHNILPDSYTAPQSFGINNDYDGVKIEYTDPIDDAMVTLSYPSDALSNPHEDKLTGVRNKVQAHIHAMRMLNRDQYTYKTCEFTAGDESNIVVRTNRVTVADQLRADVQQGSVDSITTIGSDIVLSTSDPVLLEPSGQYTAFIQTINNGVEAIAVTAHDDYSVKLARLPSGEISTGYDSVVQAVYQIVSNDDMQRDAYLVAEKSPNEGMTNKLICTNYDDRFYQNDTDYINGLITVN